MNYYTSNVKLVGGKLEYNVPDTKKISGTKFKWNTENKGKEGSVQAECCFICPDDIPEITDLSSITQQAYDDFATVLLETDKTQFTADGDDSPAVTATFPEGGGIATFTIIKPDNTKLTRNITIPVSGITVLPSANLITNDIGVTQISITSNKWNGLLGSGVLNIDST